MRGQDSATRDLDGTFGANERSAGCRGFANALKQLFMLMAQVSPDGDDKCRAALNASWSADGEVDAVDAVFGYLGRCSGSRYGWRGCAGSGRCDWGVRFGGRAACGREFLERAAQPLGGLKR